MPPGAKYTSAPVNPVNTRKMPSKHFNLVMAYASQGSGVKGHSKGWECVPNGFTPQSTLSEELWSRVFEALFLPVDMGKLVESAILNQPPAVSTWTHHQSIIKMHSTPR